MPLKILQLECAYKFITYISFHYKMKISAQKEKAIAYVLHGKQGAHIHSYPLFQRIS